MLETIKSIDGETLLPISADALSALGLQPGAQVMVTVIEQSVVIQPIEAVPADSEFVQTLKSVLDKRRSAFQELA